MSEVQNQTTAISPKSIRMSDEVYEKFKEIGKEIGGNQQDTIATLISSWELEQERNKDTINGRMDEVSRFENYQKILKGLFLKLLEENVSMGDSFKMDHENELKSKDKVIVDLQKKMEALETENMVFSTEKEKAETQVAHLSEIKESNDSTIMMLNEKVKELEKKYEDAYRQNTVLQERVNRFDSKEKTLTELVSKTRKEKDFLMETNNNLQGEIQYLKTELEMSKVQNGQLKEENTRIEERLERIFEQKLSVQMDRKQIEMEEKYRKEYDKRQQELQEKLEKIQDKYMNLLEQKSEKTD